MNTIKISTVVLALGAALVVPEFCLALPLRMSKEEIKSLIKTSLLNLIGQIPG